MTWKLVLDLLDAIDNNIYKANELIQLLPPGEPWHQEALTDVELKQQILGHAPNVENANRSIRELYLRKVNRGSS